MKGRHLITNTSVLDDKSQDEMFDSSSYWHRYVVNTSCHIVGQENMPSWSEEFHDSTTKCVKAGNTVLGIP